MARHVAIRPVLIMELNDLESRFAEMLIWYDGFKDAHRLKVLPHCNPDIVVMLEKMDEARACKDYRTSDFIRGILKRAGVQVRQRAIS
jgi:hypothetical protein